MMNTILYISHTSKYDGRKYYNYCCDLHYFFAYIWKDISISNEKNIEIYT